MKSFECQSAILNNEWKRELSILSNKFHFIKQEVFDIMLNEINIESQMCA